MKEYDIFLPLRYNDGRHIEPQKLRQVQQQLLSQFEGLTYFPQANHGFWKQGDITYRDEIIVLRVVASNARPARQFLKELKEQLKADLDQEEIFIVERDVKTL